MNIAQASIENDPRWQAFCARDPAFDGRFFVAVRSTGIYCRPSCPARRPSPENVVFYATGTEASAAGFRACRKCHPDRPEQWRLNAAVVTEICRELEMTETIPSLDQIARKAGFSPYHFHRLFKAATGLTPTEYAQHLRIGKARELLEFTKRPVDQIAWTVGYEDAGAFRKLFHRIIGLSPSDYRQRFGVAGATNAAA